MRKMRYSVLLLSVLIGSGPAFAQDMPVGPSLTSELATLSYGEGLVPFRCPIEQIRNAYQNLVNPNDTLMALAIEKQTLAICRQSQEALIRIAENEVRLRELFEPILMPPAPPPPPEPPIAQIMAPGPARDVAELLPLIPVVVEEIEPPAPTTDYVLGVLMRDPEGRKAILVRGEDMFTVRPGEEVADGVMVTEIDESRVTIEDPDGNVFVLE